MAIEPEKSVAASTVLEVPALLAPSQSSGAIHGVDQGTPLSSNPHPARNWPVTKRWTTTVLLSAIAFLQPLAETALAPIQGQISHDLHIEFEYQWIAVNSLILIGLGLSSLVLAPLSEVYGRKPVLIGASASFAIWNTACGTVKTLDQLLALRLLSGFGASVGDAVAGGVMSDLWNAEIRGRAYATYMVAPTLGTAVGPILGAYVAGRTNWRWAFWVTSIAAAVSIVATFLFYPETFGPKLNRSRDIRVGDSVPDAELQAPRDAPSGMETLKKTGLITNLQRPFRMLGTQIIVQLLAVYMALLYGIMWLFLFMYPRMWTEQYGQSSEIASLNYLSFGFGLVAGVHVAGHVSDKTYKIFKARNHGVGRPEYRVPPLLIGTILAPAGMLWWGWSGQAKLHWAVPNAGSFVFALGTYVCSSCVSVYTIDAYTTYAASAISTNLVLRSVSAALFPLFAPYLFDRFGFGLAATVLASAFFFVGSIITTLLWFYGQDFRARSRYHAAEDDQD
ncbi:MFS general substrate transporter [Xylaria sp. CBS 124048]|nr:MFS general substrate transporter [Xylaria sp. CBS 124048]